MVLDWGRGRAWPRRDPGLNCIPETRLKSHLVAQCEKSVLSVKLCVTVLLSSALGPKEELGKPTVSLQGKLMGRAQGKAMRAKQFSNNGSEYGSQSSGRPRTPEQD